MEALIKTFMKERNPCPIDQCIVYATEKFLKNEPFMLPTALERLLKAQGSIAEVDQPGTCGDI